MWPLKGKGTKASLSTGEKGVHSILLLRSQGVWELQDPFEVVPQRGIMLCSGRKKGSAWCRSNYFCMFVRVAINSVIMSDSHIGIIIHDYY